MMIEKYQKKIQSICSKVALLRINQILDLLLECIDIVHFIESESSDAWENDRSNTWANILRDVVRILHLINIEEMEECKLLISCLVSESKLFEECFDGVLNKQYAIVFPTNTKARKRSFDLSEKNFYVCIKHRHYVLCNQIEDAKNRRKNKRPADEDLSTFVSIDSNNINNQEQVKEKTVVTKRKKKNYSTDSVVRKTSSKELTANPHNYTNINNFINNNNTSTDNFIPEVGDFDDLSDIGDSSTVGGNVIEKDNNINVNLNKNMSLVIESNKAKNGGDDGDDGDSDGDSSKDEKEKDIDKEKRVKDDKEKEKGEKGIREKEKREKEAVDKEQRDKEVKEKDFNENNRRITTNENETVSNVMMNVNVTDFIQKSPHINNNIIVNNINNSNSPCYNKFYLMFKEISMELQSICQYKYNKGTIKLSIDIDDNLQQQLIEMLTSTKKNTLFVEESFFNETHWEFETLHNEDLHNLTTGNGLCLLNATYQLITRQIGDEKEAHKPVPCKQVDDFMLDINVEKTKIYDNVDRVLSLFSKDEGIQNAYKVYLDIITDDYKENGKNAKFTDWPSNDIVGYPLYMTTYARILAESSGTKTPYIARFPMLFSYTPTTVNVSSPLRRRGTKTFLVLSKYI